MKLLEKLVNLDGVSGNEHQVRQFVIKEAKKYLKDVKVDNMGNVIVRKKGTSPSVMLLAHMDEIGLLVNSIDKDGKIYITNIGGIDAPILLSHRVEVQTKTGKITGIITNADALNDTDQNEKIITEKLFVFTGLNKSELEKKGVKIGSYISFSKSSSFCHLGSDDIIAGKALDDRIGCYVLLEVMKRLKTKNEVIFVFTVQEEVGLYGAKASVFNLEPEYAIAVDVTGHDEENDRLLLGRGPVLTIKDAEMIGNQCLNDALESAAKKQKIPLQREVSEKGTTDASSIFAAKGGVPSAALGVSVANIHTTMGSASVKDIEATIRVLAEFLKAPPVNCQD